MTTLTKSASLGHYIPKFYLYCNVVCRVEDRKTKVFCAWSDIINLNLT